MLYCLAHRRNKMLKSGLLSIYSLIFLLSTYYKRSYCFVIASIYLLFISCPPISGPMALDRAAQPATIKSSRHLCTTTTARCHPSPIYFSPPSHRAFVQRCIISSHPAAMLNCSYLTVATYVAY
jgi:hypothetical protein